MTAAKFDHLIHGLASDLAAYPHQLDLVTDRVLVTRIGVERQRATSFLDERALAAGTEGAWFSWHAFEEGAARAAPGALAYVFHIGHCGSTLVSRLLEEATSVRALREPLPLRVFATDKAEEGSGAALLSPSQRARRLSMFERVWSRSGAVVKSTSMCNGLIDDIAAAAPAVFVHMPARDHLAALLGGANALADLRGFAQMRRRRMAGLAADDFRLSDLSPGELAGMSWLVEILSAARAKKPLLDVAFDAFLADPGANLRAIAAHLRLKIDEGRLAAAFSGPMMKSYAKAPEHPFDAAARRAGLDEAHRLHAAEIARGLRWIEARARKLSDGAKALARFPL